MRDEAGKFDWQAAWRHGAAIAGDYSRSGTALTDQAIAWALLCEAARVSRSYPAPPRSGYPVKSSWPDFPDEVTMWHKMSAYLQGDLDELPEDESRPPMPSAAEISRADHVLTVWHHAVSLGRNKKRAVYLRACGAKAGKIARVSGVTTTELKTARRRALGEMLRHISRLY